MTITKRVKEGNKNVKDLKNKSFLLNSFQMKMRFFLLKKKEKKKGRTLCTKLMN